MRQEFCCIEDLAEERGSCMYSQLLEENTHPTRSRAPTNAPRFLPLHWQVMTVNCQNGAGKENSCSDKKKLKLRRWKKDGQIKWRDKAQTYDVHDTRGWQATFFLVRQNTFRRNPRCKAKFTLAWIFSGTEKHFLQISGKCEHTWCLSFKYH